MKVKIEGHDKEIHVSEPAHEMVENIVA